MEKLVSVIIPTYNRAGILPTSIKSVINQSYKNLEIIVWDDGSDDNTEDVVEQISDPRIKYYRGENGGAGHARNMGISKATGEYIAFHDSDDICRPYRIEEQVKYLEANNLDMVYAQLERHDFNDPNITHRYPDDGQIGKTKEETYNNFLTRSSVWTQVILCRASCCKQILFNEWLPAMEDWEWSLRFSKCFSVGWQSLVVVDSFIQENSISRSSHNKMLTLFQMYGIYYDDIEKLKIKYIWKWLIAYYNYIDNPDTFFEFGTRSIIKAYNQNSVKGIIYGLLYIFYFPCIKKIVRYFKSIV